MRFFVFESVEVSLANSLVLEDHVVWLRICAFTAPWLSAKRRGRGGRSLIIEVRVFKRNREQAKARLIRVGKLNFKPRFVQITELTLASAGIDSNRIVYQSVIRGSIYLKSMVAR
jgi:hypothetical protein